MYLRMPFIFFLAIAFSFSNAESKQKRISVLPFKGWQSNSNNHAKQYRAALTDKILTKIIKSHRFIVIDRENLNKIIKEQKLQTSSGLIDQSTAIEIGKLMGIDRFILGNFTRNSIVHHPAKYSEYDGKKTKLSDAFYSAKIDVTMKLLDVETGVYLEATEANGNATGKNKNEAYMNALEKVADNVLIAFQEYFKIEAHVTQIDKSNIYIDAGRSLGVEEGMSFTVYNKDMSASGLVSGQFKIVSTQDLTSKGKLFGDYSEVAVGDLVVESKVNLKVEARIMEKKFNKVLINAGSDLGLSVGSTFSVIGETTQMIDPITGEVYGTETKDIGKIYIYELGPGFARGKIISGRYRIKEGMKINQVGPLLPKIGFSLEIGRTPLDATTNDDTDSEDFASNFLLSTHMHNTSNKILLYANMNMFGAGSGLYGLLLEGRAYKGIDIIPEFFSISAGVGVGGSSCTQNIDLELLRSIQEIQSPDEPLTDDTTLSSSKAFVTANLLGRVTVGNFILFSNLGYSTLEYKSWSYSYRPVDDGNEDTYESLEFSSVGPGLSSMLPYSKIKMPLSFSLGLSYEF